MHVRDLTVSRNLSRPSLYHAQKSIWVSYSSCEDKLTQ